MFVTRLISGIVLLVILITTICVSGPLLFLFLLLISLIGMFELYRAAGLRKKGENALTLVSYAGAAVYYLFVFLNLKDYLLGVLIGALIALLFVYVFTYPKYHADEVMTAFFGIAYVAVCLSFIYQTRQLPDGMYSVWLIVICSWGCDTMAYVFGRLFGRHKMAPVLSPKKSYALICAVGALISMVGDLAASAIERKHGIKDYGRLIPGHGGILDRFDSVIITAPIIYLLAYAFQ